MLKVKLESLCPSSCVCGGKQAKKWHHVTCLTQSYIDNNGDISCQNDCSEYFIQHASFKCQQSSQFEQFKSSTQFLMALAQAMQSAEFSLSDQAKVEFITTLNQKVVQKWSN